MKVQAVDGDAYVIDGKRYSDRAVIAHFRALDSHLASREAVDARRKRVKRNLWSIIPPAVGLVAGAWVGFWLTLGDMVNGGHHSAGPFAASVGSGVALGGLCIGLPMNLYLGAKAGSKRESAARAFNEDLYQRLQLKEDRRMDRP